MAPGVLTDDTRSVENLTIKNREEKYPKPLQLKGVLDQAFPYEQSTPLIGREYPTINIVNDLLNAPNADDLLLDLAITISQQGVVFFRSQDNLTDELQKDFVQRLGQLTGKPSASTLHTHPIHNSKSEFGLPDSQISVIDSKQRKAHIHPAHRKTRHGAAIWHSDIQFEPFPADYTSLRLHTLPSTGGDTLWASGYELYDRFSPPYQKFLETLTATFVGQEFVRLAQTDSKVQLNEGPRGHPENIGTALEAVHPVVRTNPVTGWKSLYALGPFPQRINDVFPEESEGLLRGFTQKILEDHAVTVRFKWRNRNDFAIWDNRSAFHSATNDYDHLGERTGNRVVGIGERPYLDPNSKSREQALGIA